jgi:excisionase family DNA binding protein
MNHGESFISVQEAARVIGVTDAWIIKMIKRNDLLGFRLNGKAWALSRASVENNRKEYESGHVGRPRSKPGKPSKK